MKVGNKIVFFRAEVDAVDENGAAIEIKASNPRSKVLGYQGDVPDDKQWKFQFQALPWRKVPWYSHTSYIDEPHECGCYCA